jgi:hypothetical protein
LKPAETYFVCFWCDDDLARARRLYPCSEGFSWAQIVTVFMLAAKETEQEYEYCTYGFCLGAGSDWGHD